MLAKIKNIFQFIWDVLEESGRLRARQHLRNYSAWDQ